ncbi:hypothetical protein CK203_043917 [Vitis vinifera]|uniref:Uncharacterized protein n=1 Tax=Vitis vinifera TaxID=29760 RepID=A0A438HVI5_VITVI|nr:hypothetical protein CK203_043917 [Vitis vinifera]
MELKLKVELRICGYRWSIDLVIGVNVGVGRVWSHILVGKLEEFMEGVSRRLDQIESSRHDHHLVDISTDETVPHASQTTQVLPPRTLHGVPFHLSDHCETAPPFAATVLSPIVTTIDDTRLADQEAKLRDGLPQLSLRDFALGRTVAEFLTQLAFSANIDVSRRELEATRQRPNEFISYFDLKILVHATFNVEEVIARGLWTDTAHFPDSNRKKSVESSSRFGEVDTISYQHQRPTHHSPYRPPTVRAHLSHPQHQYQTVYVQQPYIAQTRCSHDHHIREPLFPHRLDHMHRGLRDSSLHWA